MTIASPAVFGARIHRERIRQGLTFTQLAAKAGLQGTTTLKRIEIAEGQPGLFRAAAVAAVLGLSLDALLAPADCPVCDGLPPAGFTCQACGKPGEAP